MKFTSTPLFKLVVLPLVLMANILTAQDSSISYLRDLDGRIREHNVDFLKMKLDVRFNVKEGKVIGNVSYQFKPIQYIVDTLFLNAPDINIKSVLLDGKAASFTTDSFGLILHFAKSLDWNKQYQLDIAYEATPRKGLYFIGWNVDAKNTENDKYFTRKQIWTQGQGIDNRYWFPCYDDVDDKMLTETVITFDSAYTVISNGVLKDKKPNADGSFTWHYAMNHPMVPYLVMIGIDKYGYKDYKSKNGMVSRQYYYADRPQEAAPTYLHSDEMMDFLVEQTGFAYPWPTYANIPVQDFMYGAMENTTATVYGDFLMTDASMNFERTYTATNAHELTHQWFGDCITEYGAAHHWLHESFATYYSKQFMRKVNGEDAYQWAKRQETLAAITAEKADRFPIGHSRAGSNRVYPKGSFVIDMIRYVVGDSVFKKCITGYLKKHQYDNVNNHDFMMAFMENAGINLDWFFDEWVYRAGLPNYEVSYEKFNDKVAFYVKQTQRHDELESYFKMPVVFEVHLKDEVVISKTQWLSHAIDTVYIKMSGSDLDYALFDPGSMILKTVTFKKSSEELATQAERAPYMIDRYDALIGLREFDADKKRDLLIRIFKTGNYNAIQNEIIQQLSKDYNTATVELMGNALHYKDFNVRRAVVENLDSIPQSMQPDFEAMLKDSSFITRELALRRLCKLYPAKAVDYLGQVKNVKGIANNVRIAWLELNSKFDSLNKANYIKPLVEYTSNRYEFRTRVKAMEAVERIAYCDADLVSNLLNATLYTNSRLANPARKTLTALFKKSGNLQLAKDVYAKGQWKDWEKKIIEGILKA